MSATLANSQHYSSLPEGKETRRKEPLSNAPVMQKKARERRLRLAQLKGRNGDGEREEKREEGARERERKASVCQNTLY